MGTSRSQRGGHDDAARRKLRDELLARGAEIGRMANEFQITFGDGRLKAYRSASGLTQDEVIRRVTALADGTESQLDRAGLSRLEKWPGPSSRRPTAPLLSILATVYGVHPLWLVDPRHVKELAFPDQCAFSHLANTVPAHDPNSPPLLNVDDLPGLPPHDDPSLHRVGDREPDNHASGVTTVVAMVPDPPRDEPSADPPPQPEDHARTPIRPWTGLAATVLCDTLDMRDGDFATKVGVSAAAPQKWRDRGVGITIRTATWSQLDNLLNAATDGQRATFEHALALAQTESPSIMVDHWSGAEAYLLFQALQMSVRAGAARLGVDPRTITNWRQRGATVGLDKGTQRQLNAVLRQLGGKTRAAFGAALTEYLKARNAGRAAHSTPADSTDDQDVPGLDLGVAAGPAHPAVVDVLGPAGTLDAIETCTRKIIERYEADGPRLLMPEVQALRRLCQHLGGRVSSKGERSRLAKAFAKQAALLAYMSVNVSQFAAAQAYALEATVLARHLNDHELLAWLRGTESFAAYYRKDYVAARRFAESGLDLAGDDSQRIRLLSNGLARAAGKLGDRRTVDRALGEALDLAACRPGTPGMTACIDLQPYGWARTAANAATAYLSVGDRPRVLDLAGELAAVVAESESDWSRSLVALDEATALTLGPDPDVERASAVGLAALASSEAKPIASVVNRAGELAVSLARHGPHPASQQFADALHEWRHNTAKLSS